MLIEVAAGDAFGVTPSSLTSVLSLCILYDRICGSGVELRLNSLWGTRIPAEARSGDASMAVATMVSIISSGGSIDLVDVTDQFLNWQEHNKYCSTGQAFGRGKTVMRQRLPTRTQQDVESRVRRYRPSNLDARRVRR